MVRVRETEILKIVLPMLVWAAIQFFWVPLYAAEDREIARQLEALNWYSEEYPPYNYSGEDGIITGISVDILMAALDRTGARLDRKEIKILPWKEGYKRVLSEKGSVLFSTTYTPERQQMMKFVGPAVPVRVSVIALKSRKFVIGNAADLSTLKIGVVRDDIGDQLISKLAMSDDNIAKKDTLKQLSYFFQRKRVDAIAYASNVFSYSLKKSGLDPNEYEEIYLLKEGHMGYAFHYSTPAAVLVRLQKAIDDLHADGTIKKIIGSYIR